MNGTFLKKLFRMAQIILALLAGFLFAPKIFAQDVAQDELQMDNRFLFIFSTSAEMKSRVKATQSELNQLLAFGIRGEMRAGDTLGVWTIDNQLRAGQFPMLNWSPENAASIAGEINKFVGRQTFSRTNNFAALTNTLNQVIESSPQLTILIFCDGESKFTGTPYDDGINRVFAEREAALKKSKLPFVIVLRTQLGKYIVCTVNFPPGMVNVPPFQPIPKPAPVIVNNPPPVINVNVPPPPQSQPPQNVSPLVLIGTHVETNWDAYHYVLTNSPAPKANAIPTSINSAPTNAPQTEAATNSLPKELDANLTPTNSVASGNSSDGHNGTLALAAGFLIGAIALGILFVFRSRRADQSSLITRTMGKK